MAINPIPRPSVIVRQEFGSASLLFANPVLPACSVGPAFEVIDALNSDGTVNANAKWGAYNQMPSLIAQSAFPSPRGNIDEVDVLENEIEAFLQTGDDFYNLPIRPYGDAFLKAWNKAYRAAYYVEKVSFDLDGLSLSFCIDNPARTSLVNDVVVEFSGIGLSPEEVAEQINSAYGETIAYPYPSDSPTGLVIASSTYGAISSLTFRGGSSAAIEFGIHTTNDTRIEGSGFKAYDDGDGDTLSAWIAFFAGAWYLNGSSSEGTSPQAWSATGSAAILLEYNSQGLDIIRRGSASSPVYTGSSATIPLQAASVLRPGDEMFIEGASVGNAEVIAVESDRFKLGLLNTSKSTYDNTGAVSLRVYDPYEVGLLIAGSPFSPRFVWFKANGLTYNQAAVAATLYSIDGTPSQNAYVQTDYSVEDMRWPYNNTLGLFNLTGLTLRVLSTVNGEDQPIETHTFTKAYDLTSPSVRADFLNDINASFTHIVWTFETIDAKAYLRAVMLDTASADDKITILGDGTANPAFQFTAKSTGTVGSGKDVSFGGAEIVEMPMSFDLTAMTKVGGTADAGLALGILGFQVGEVITGASSGETATIAAITSGALGITGASGAFTTGETVEGGTSGAKAKIRSAGDTQLLLVQVEVGDTIVGDTSSSSATVEKVTWLGAPNGFFFTISNATGAFQTEDILLDGDVVGSIGASIGLELDNTKELGRFTLMREYEGAGAINSPFSPIYTFTYEAGTGVFKEGETVTWTNAGNSVTFRVLRRKEWSTGAGTATGALYVDNIVEAAPGDLAALLAAMTGSLVGATSGMNATKSAQTNHEGVIIYGPVTPIVVNEVDALVDYINGDSVESAFSTPNAMGLVLSTLGSVKNPWISATNVSDSDYEKLKIKIYSKASPVAYTSWETTLYVSDFGGYPNSLTFSAKGSGAPEEATLLSGDITYPQTLSTLSLSLKVNGVTQTKTFGGAVTVNDKEELLAALEVLAFTGIIWAAGPDEKIICRTLTTGFATASLEVVDNTGWALIEFAAGAKSFGNSTIAGKRLRFQINDNPFVYDVVAPSASLKDLIDAINESAQISLADFGGSTLEALALSSPLKGVASKVYILDGDDSVTSFQNSDLYPGALVAWRMGLVASTLNNETYGTGRPNPDAYIDPAGSGGLGIGAEILRNPVDGSPYPNVSADLFIQYRALRLDVSPKAAQKGVLAIRGFEQLAEVLSPLDARNPLGLALSLQMTAAPDKTNYGIGVSEITSSAMEGTEQAYNEAFDFLKSKDVYAIAPLTFNENVHQALKTHVETMSEPEKRAERIAFVCPEVPDFAAPTTVANGSKGETTAGVANQFILDKNPAAALNAAGVNPALPFPVSKGVYLKLVITTLTGSETRIYNVSSLSSGVVANINVGPFTDPDDQSFYSTTPLTETLSNTTWGLYVRGKKLVIPGSTLVDYAAKSQAIAEKAYAYKQRRLFVIFPDTFVTNLDGVETELPGYYMAATQAGMTAGLKPSQGKTNYPIPGWTGVKGVKEFENDQLDLIAGGGNYIIFQEGETSPLTARQQLSTDVSSIEKRERSITESLDWTARVIRNAWRVFLGVRNVSDELLDEFSMGFAGLESYVVETEGILRSLNITSIEEDPDRKDGIVIRATAGVFYPLNNIDITIVV